MFLSSMKRYMQFVKPYYWQIALTIVIGIFKFAIPLFIPLLIKIVIDDIIGAKGLSSDEKLTQLYLWLGGTAILFFLLRPPIEYYRQYYAQYVSNKILYDIRQHLYGHLQRLSLRYYANTRAGEIISRVINDVEQTKNFVMIGLMNLWLDLDDFNRDRHHANNGCAADTRSALGIPVLCIQRQVLLWKIKRSYPG